jgi:transketolase
VLAECAVRNNIFVLTGDSGLGVFDQFREEHPERFLNLGVAEQNAIGFAAGLAMTGFKVIVYNIAPFVLYRCYEQVRNDICCQKLPVVLVGTGSGITYAPQGMSHYSVEDLGIASTLPDLTVISPSDPVEARSAAEHSLECSGPVYIRLAKRGEPVIHQEEGVDISLPQLIREGDGVAIVCHGSIASEVMSAGELLKQRGIRPRIISLPMVQPLKGKILSTMLTGIEHLVCVEEHYVNCGLGMTLASYKLESRAPWDLTLLGIPAEVIHAVNVAAELRDQFGISAQAIAERVTAVMGMKES